MKFTREQLIDSDPKEANNIFKYEETLGDFEVVSYDIFPDARTVSVFRFENGFVIQTFNPIFEGESKFHQLVMTVEGFHLLQILMGQVFEVGDVSKIFRQ